MAEKYLSTLSVPATVLLACFFVATAIAQTIPGPKIVRPWDRVVVPDELRIITEKGPENHISTEIEIWRVSNGGKVEKAWQAKLAAGDLTSASLEDGSFEAGIDSLKPWTRYAIRARHGTTAGYTDWGPERVVRTDDGSEDVFRPSVIGDVWLTIPESSWEPIDDEALTACEPHPRSYYPGAVKIGSVEFPGSGVQVKGGCGSSRTLNDKAAFKANMAWDDPDIPGCAEERRYKGVKKLTLNNQVEDASFTHERIGYHFLEKLGIPVPRAAPVRVHVNGELWGLYLNLETIDRRFLSRHFDSKEGMLYEADYGCDIGEANCFEPKFDTDECDEPPEGDPTDMTPLHALHARLAQIPSEDFYPAVNRIIDFDAFLTMWAAATVVGFWDGYPNDANNYRIYHDPTDDRWTIIPTGIDQLFEENVNPFNPVGMLSVRCLAEDDCKAAFHSKLSWVIDKFEASNYPAMARAIEKQIAAEVETDPRKEITLDEWRAAVDSTVDYMRRRPGELRRLLSQPASKVPAKQFNFHVFTDPEGDRFMFASWADKGNETGSVTRWLTAKGKFEGLTAQADVFELSGSSADGVKVGLVFVNFADCETAEFQFAPDDDSLERQVRTAPVDPSIWKYCK